MLESCGATVLCQIFGTKPVVKSTVLKRQAEMSPRMMRRLVGAGLGDERQILHLAHPIPGQAWRGERVTPKSFVTRWPEVMKAAHRKESTQNGSSSSRNGPSRSKSHSAIRYDGTTCLSLERMSGIRGTRCQLG